MLSQQYILLSFVAALGCAVLSGMGVGSAGLFVLYLTGILHIEQFEAQGLNLIFFLFCSLASLVYHVKHRKIPWRLVLFMIPFSAVGSYLGAMLAKALSGDILRRIFGGMLTVSGIITLFSKGKKKKSEKASDAPRDS